MFYNRKVSHTRHSHKYGSTKGQKNERRKERKRARKTSSLGNRNEKYPRIYCKQHSQDLTLIRGILNIILACCLQTKLLPSEKEGWEERDLVLKFRRQLAPGGTQLPARMVGGDGCHTGCISSRLHFHNYRYNWVCRKCSLTKSWPADSWVRVHVPELSVGSPGPARGLSLNGRDSNFDLSPGNSKT